MPRLPSAQRCPQKRGSLYRSPLALKWSLSFFALKGFTCKQLHKLGERASVSWRYLDPLRLNIDSNRQLNASASAAVVPLMASPTARPAPLIGWPGAAHAGGRGLCRVGVSGSWTTVSFNYSLIFRRFIRTT